MDASLKKTEKTAEKLLRIMFFTLIISVMNATIFNVALPSISEEFSLSASNVSWMTTGYGIVYAIGTVTYGKLADRYRLKNVLTFGLILMSLGSLAGLAATQYGMLVAGRMLQAAGAAVIPSISMLIPVKYFTSEKRGRAIGTLVSGLALGNALSPIAAGLVAGMLHWRLLFCFSFLIWLTLPFFRKHLDDQPIKTASKLDVIGGVLLAGTVACVLLSLTRSLIFLPVGLLSFVLLLLRIRFAADPFIEPSLFRSKNYSLAVVVALLAAGLGAGVPFIAPQLLSNVNHVSSAYIGFVLFPGAFAAALLGRAAGKLADRKGNSFLFYAAAIPLFMSFCVLSTLSGMSPAWLWIVLALANIGQTFIQVAMSNNVSRTLSKEQAGIGMGFYTMMTFMAGAASTAMIGKVLDALATVRLNPWQIYEQAAAYSNAFFMLACVSLLAIALYFVLFGTKSVQASSFRPDPKKRAKAG
ncbi:MFS transporter [Paenibacillus cookii]|uniref:MFS transporter n=1 Tax=Paenibacillus cookii TaxID=157839 RepID=A0ABQ4LZ77_9BACL|nr:MFS transporter [Paenibacillus cookii]GIO68443.1 MFS transporter [Paenibacillus cookii]